MEGKSIIFFSLHYPYHISDSYLDTEFNLLAAQFDKAVIITNNTFSIEKRPTPTNAIVYRFNPSQTAKPSGVIKLIFKPFLYKELYWLLMYYRPPLTLQLLREIFAFYSRSLSTFNFLENVIDEQGLNTSNLLVYSYWMIEGSMAAAQLKSKCPEVKIVSRVHSLDVYFERSPVQYHPFRRFIYNMLDRAYFISENALKYFVAKHHLGPASLSKAVINRIGIKSDNSFIDKADTNTIRIISVAYIQKIKRIDLIIDALSAINGLKIEWIHAGHSNQNEQDFEDIKIYAAEKLSAGTNVSFLFTGKTSKEDLFKMYAERHFDFFLNVSETEGIPVSMMEAMSFSVPVIGTNVGGVAEIVEDGVNGYLLSPYPDAAEVTRAVETFAALPVLQKTNMRKQAFNTWQHHYNASQNNKAFVDDILKIMQ